MSFSSLDISGCCPTLKPFSCTNEIADLYELLIELYWYPSAHSCARKSAKLVTGPENGLNLHSTHQLCHLPTYDLFVLVLHDLRRSAVASSERPEMCHMAN